MRLLVVKTTVVIILTIVCVLSIILKAQIKGGNWRNHGFFEHATTKVFKILFHYPRVHIALQVCLFLFTAYFLSHEIAKVYDVLNRADRPDDFRWYYTASQMVRDGTSPYAIEDFLRYLLPLARTEREIGPFVYFPNLLPFIYPLSYFSFAVSAKLFTAANLLGVGFLLFGAVKLVSCQTRGVTFSCLCLFSIIVGVTNSLWLGNIATMVVPCLMWTYIFAQRHRDGLAGLLLGISTVKPTLSIFFVMYFLIMKKLSLVLWCLITSSILMFIGLFMSHTSIYDFVSLYRLGTDLFFLDYWNSIYTSPTRIDMSVLAPRFISYHQDIANIIAIILKFVPLLATLFYLYRKRRYAHSLDDISLSDMSLVSCMSLLITYSQPSNGSILIFPWVFLINYLSLEIIARKPGTAQLFFWFMGIFSLMIHTHIFYHYISHLIFRRGISPITLRTIASIPNFAVLCLGVSLFILAQN